MLPKRSSTRPRPSIVVQQSQISSDEGKPANDTGTVDTEPTVQEIQRKPWKYIGIKGYAEFLASDDDFFILRRFKNLNTRIALALQDEISELEYELDVLDARYSDKFADDINNGTFRGDMEDRSEITRSLSKKLKRYNEFILQQQHLRKYPVAPRRDIKSIRNWHFNHDYGAIAADEQKYLDHDEDLICVTPKEKTPLRRLLDSSLRLRTLEFWKHREQVVPTYDANYVAYYSDKRMDQFSSAAIAIIGVIMLITPIWVLQATQNFRSKLIIITIFISVFLLVLSSTMATRPFEALAATAGYAAILMVFLQLNN